MKQSNVVKCKYCDYTVARFKGRSNYSGRNLSWHVISAHEKEFLTANGGYETFEDYVEAMDDEESNVELLS